MNWTDWQAMTPIAFDGWPHAIHDLLLTDFGMHSEWEMIARKAFMGTTKRDDRVHITVPMHPDALASVADYIHRQQFTEASVETAERRLARLRARARTALDRYGEHGWFRRLAVYGTANTTPPLTGWLDEGFLSPTWLKGMRPVVLFPKQARMVGVNVCKFEIEEVDGWPQQTLSA